MKQGFHIAGRFMNPHQLGGGRGFDIGFLINPTEKISDAIIVERKKFELFVYINYGRKISTYCSKLGSNCQILINHA